MNWRNIFMETNEGLTISGNSTDTITIEEIDVSSVFNQTTINIPAYTTGVIPTLSTSQLSGLYNVNMNSQSSNYYFNNPAFPSITSNSSPPGLSVLGNAEFHGDIKWKGRNLGQLLENIEKRLSILSPDPEKLEHFEALKKAYEHYKTLEALCELPSKEE